MSFGSGVVAALAAPLLMTIGFIVWDEQWRGSAFSLNMFKCTLASLGFLVISLTTRSPVFPSDIFTSASVGFLMLSSTIGILVGDWLWLEGLRLLGARRVIVVDSCKPFLAALLGWAILGEALRPAAWGGMALTVVGVLIVSFESEKDGDTTNDSGVANEMGREHSTEEIDEINSDVLQCVEGNDLESIDEATDTGETIKQTTPLDAPFAITTDTAMDAEAVTNIQAGEYEANEEKLERRRISTPSRYRRGYAMAVVNVVLDTYGSLLTKEHGVGMTTWEINLIRFGFAGAVMLSMSVAMHLKRCFNNMHRRKIEKKRETFAEGELEEEHDKWTGDWYSLPGNMNRKSWFYVCIGVAFVTFGAPALSNYALFQIALALTLTLTSVGPLYALPLSWLLQHDRATLRACIGACLAVGGIVVLSFRGQ